jgi:hypothetical protein
MAHLEVIASELRLIAAVRRTAAEVGAPMPRIDAYGRTRKEVRDKVDKTRERLATGAPVRDSKQTVGEWLAHWRATTLAASDRKESTRELYGNLCRHHLEPEPFRAIQLDKLKPSHIDALVLEMKTRTKPGKTERAEPTRALSDSTIRQTYTILRAGLDGAVRDGLIARNLAALSTSRRWRTCSVTAASASPPTSTATQATKPPGTQLTAGAGHSGYESESVFDSRCATCCATYRRRVPLPAEPRAADIGIYLWKLWSG